MVMGDISVETEVIVVGGGPGGYVAAIRLAQLGKKVVLVDEGGLGGVCLQHGCIPSKALINAANKFHSLETLKTMGITVGKPKLNPKKLFAWKSEVVSKLTQGIETLCKKYGVDYIKGRARFESNRRVKVIGGDSYNFDHAIIATGSAPFEIPSIPFDHKLVLNSDDAISLGEIPKSLAVIGGGYVGMELGMAFAKLGSQVTIIEGAGRILGVVDEECAAVVAKRAEEIGMAILTNTKAESVKVGRLSVTINLSGDVKKKSIKAEKLLVCVGRRAYTESLGVSRTGAQVDEKGFIKVDAQMRTADHRIFAVGDVTGDPMLAHRATRQGKVAAEVIAGQKSAFDNVAIPAVVYTEPEIASVGLLESEAVEQGFDVEIGRFPFVDLGRAHTTNETLGFVKVIVDKKSKVVLGVHIVGEHASDMISEATLAIEMGALVDDIALTIHPHPTFPEALAEAMEVAEHKAVDIFVPEEK